MEKTEALGMQCPVCSVDLVMSERQSVEIDYCPKCRGIWLDRGELDKIIEKAIAEAKAQQPAPMSFLPQSDYEKAKGYLEDSHREKHRDYQRRGSFLERLFD